MKPDFIIVSGSVNRDLAIAIVQLLDVGIGKCCVQRFPDTEINVQLEESVRDRDVFIVQSSCPARGRTRDGSVCHCRCVPSGCGCNYHVDLAVFRLRSKRQTQRPTHGPDGKTGADFAEHAGIGHVIAVDLHSPRVEGFFHVPVENLRAVPVISDELKPHLEPESVIVSPDTGGMKLAGRMLRSWAARSRCCTRSD